MATRTSTRTVIGVEAPDAVSAHRLQRSLGELHAAATGHGRRWQVTVHEGELADVEDVVRDWLRDVGLGRTTVWVDGWPCTVRARHLDEDSDAS